MYKVYKEIKNINFQNKSLKLKEFIEFYSKIKNYHDKPDTLINNK